MPTGARYLFGMRPSNDSLASARFARACAQAREHLRRLMEENGFHEHDGWKIVESVRQVRGGTQLVMRPLHLHLTAPDDL